jgi:hypothetical protein
MDFQKLKVRLAVRIGKVFEYFLHAISDEDNIGGKNDFKFSLGRASWMIWFAHTIYFIYIGIILSYLWYLVGLSLLGYLIGTKYIVTSIGGAHVNEIVDWSNAEHP